MKKLLSILSVFTLLFLSAQQKEYVLIDLQTQKKYIKKDSLSAAKFLDSLSQNSYFFTELKDVKQVDQRTEIYFDKGKNYNEGYVKVSDSIAGLLKTETEFHSSNLDSIKRLINKKYIDQGFQFSRVKTKFHGLKNGEPKIELSVIPDHQRKINSFVVKGYEKVPKRFIKNLEKEYRGKVYNENSLLSINQNLQNHQFVTLEKPAQTLFTKDSTNIYLFLQKKKVNTFDGVIGFGNDKEKKFAFNGSLNVNFRNMFNGFETINIFWQRNADKGQTFNVLTDIPYFLKTNVGININANIYRQDSTFASVKILPSVYYHLNIKQKLGLRGNFENSSVLDTLYVQGKDYSKKGLGIWYEFQQPSENPLLLYKTKIRAEADVIKTTYSQENITANQMYYFLFAEHNLPLRNRHWLNLRGETALLNSDNTFSTNELLRFGGWNSMRGFNENSLFADFYFYGNAEYRYLIGEQAFFDVFLQYGQLNNKALALKPKLYSFGLGFNFFLPIGLMSFQISNGNEFGNPVKFNNTKIHWGILSRF